MQRIDIVIGAALFVAAAASAVGVLSYSDDRVGAFDIGWTTLTQEIALPEGTQSGGGTFEGLIGIDRANLTSMAFTVRAGSTTPLLQPTAVLVEIVSPTNDTTTAEAEIPLGPPSTIEVPIEVALASVPDATSVTGPDPEAARGALNATLSSTLGVGTWTLRVSFAPSAPGPIGGVASYTVGGEATLTYYEGDIVLVSPEVGR